MLRFVLMILIASMPAFANAQALATPREGVDYFTLSSPQPQFTGRGKIEVAEVFGYTCPHCAHFQPMVNSWKKSMPTDVRFVYIAAPFGGYWDSYAKAFYAAEGMGLQDKTHDNVFKALHIQGKLKTGTDEEAADVYAALGVDRAKFVTAMNSKSVEAKMKRAKQFAQRAGVNATPSVVVAGKYRVMASQDRGLQGMLSTIDFLIRKERTAAQLATKAAAPVKP
jgi:protein dithiol oxidoreductase (disulfide-forming)